MTDMLIDYHNLIIKNKYYPERWSKVVDGMMEKGKGQFLGKSRVIQLIEADFQSIMRIFMSIRMEGKYEKDQRISKCNCGSRKRILY